MQRRITIVQLPIPRGHDVNYELQWLGNSLGLFNMRDKDKSCFRVFITLLRASKNERPLSSDELAEHLGLTRATVIHHLKKLMESGLVTHEANRRYILRVHDLNQLIDAIRQDMEESLNHIRKIAEDIDKWLE